jgi:ferritin
MIKPIAKGLETRQQLTENVPELTEMASSAKSFKDGKFLDSKCDL